MRLLLLLLVLVHLVASLPLNDHPIIGILTLAVVDDSDVNNHLGSDYIPRSSLPLQTHAYLPASYVKWLEAAGARVVPIQYDASQQELDNYMKSINGLLFTGGSLSLQPNTTYFKTATYLYNKAININDAGIEFPVWGTCQGLQLLGILAAGMHGILKCGIYDSENLSLPLTAINVDTVTSSYLFGATQSTSIPIQSSVIPPLHGPYNTTTTTIYDVLFTTPSTQNLHTCGISPTDFMLSPGLHRMFQILTINQDRKGQNFVSTMQAYNYPIFAAQWHPERPGYEWDTEESSLSHSSATVSAMSHIASRFVDRCRYNQQSFISVAAEQRALIYQYPVTYTGNDTTQSYPDRQVYYF